MFKADLLEKVELEQGLQAEQLSQAGIWAGVFPRKGKAGAGVPRQEWGLSV